MDNLMGIREINKLIKEQFYIPSYQRGYRWDEKQVRDLLDDIYEFINKPNKQEGEFYCLQPIVILRNGKRCEVIDGQQRLTTIMIIQKYLKGRTYSIEYATREGSKEYLENITENAKEEIAAKNIDYYFMQKAYHVIEDWFEQVMNENDESTLEMDFYVTLGKNCKVIWYEVNDDADVESIFTRLNIGKIPLTNSELIKALLLCSSNFDADDEMIYLRQLEIANEWDIIENTLQDERFWYFINPKINNIPTRIEFIFDAISGKKSRDDDYFTFRYFTDLLQEESIIDVWKNEIKQYFQIINEWYEDQNLYHLIGYLITSGYDVSVAKLIDRYREKKYKKSEFIDYIKSLIKDSLKNIEINELEYTSDYYRINKVLLLFNVLTTMKMNDSNSRFPFDSYVKNVWSLEHIHAQQAEGLNKKELWISWIDEHIKSFKLFTDNKYKIIVEELENVDRDGLTGEKFENLFEKIKIEIQDDYGVDLNSINNLAILDRNTNSSLSNSFFDVKRNIIIDRDRNGEFIPLCTRNVFLKYYSKDPSQVHYWSETDRVDYLERIKIDLAEYLPSRGDE
ncbi:DUF262 domain-containing protein [Clostridium estertheticum]|uniref:DUF262 domain-containing protein n=1 Tax=Clostridium estertheticum TaxID=238834 RepID=UPI001C0C37E8|nr:DUF262 domain-containing protein [Clostridium estertheticum]MBU3178422.1 DUF262 domain-containing protein [Clostridium estertheticum]